MQLRAQRRRDVSQRVHIKPVHQQTRETQQIGADLECAKPAFINDSRYVDFHLHISSRHSPSAFCTGRSEKLNSTASLCTLCDTGHHDGTTNTSLFVHSKSTPPILLVPEPSATQYTAESVERYVAPWNPAGSNCRNAPIVGIG